MHIDVIVCLITSVFALCGTALGSYKGFKLTSYRVQQLEEKVDKHNNFVVRLPIVEERIRVLEDQVKTIQDKTYKLL